MVNKALRTVLYTIFTISLLFVVPFNTYAETVGGTSPIIGVNINVYDYEYGKIPYQGTVTLETSQDRWQCISSHSTMGCQVWSSQDTSGTIQDEITGTIIYTSTSTYSAYLYSYEFVLDGDYYGYVTFSSNRLGATTASTYYVNGGSFTLTSETLFTSFSITSYQLVNKNLGNMWMFPLESFNFIYFFVHNNFSQVGLESMGNYQFPVYSVAQNTQIFRTRIAPTGRHRMIFFIDKYITSNTFSDYFQFSSSSLTTENHLIIRRLMPNTSGTTTYVFYSVDIANDTESSINYNLTYIGEDCNFMPIYYDYPYNDYISTDFALLFGLSNRLLDDLDIIANGTDDSSAASSQSDLANEQLETESNTLFTQEDSFKQNMNSAMQNIDTTFSLNNFGSSFLTSAQWVRTQYETLTNNTPFASLITFSLLVGLALIVIGKVYK